MDIRSALLAVLWLVFAPLPDADAPRWEPAQPGDSYEFTLGRAHPPSERLHERWLFEIDLDWERSRQLALEMVCDLGVIALALIDCMDVANAGNAPALEPLPQLPMPGAGGTRAPDFNDIRRRSIEERMHSI